MLEERGGGSVRACKNYIVSETGKEDATAVRNEHKTGIVHADTEGKKFQTERHKILRVFGKYL